MADYLTDAKAGKLDPIYVFHSEHPILIERALTQLKDLVLPPAARGFNYDVVEGKPSANKIVALASTLPMMAKMRIVFVRDLGLMPADDAQTLLDYVAKPNPSTVIVAVTQKLDKRLKLFAQLSKKGLLHVLEAPRQLQPWVRAEAKAANVELDGNAVGRLIETVGDDLSRLALAIGQLGLYAGQRPVTGDDVDDLIADTRERSVFELTDAIGSGDRARSLAAVASLCDQRESAVGVVVMLARFVRNMAQLHKLRAAGVPRNEWGSRIGVPPFVVDKLAQQARGYTPDVLAAATVRIATADRALKGDITLMSHLGDRWTGPQIKALGRDLADRVILEDVVDGIVALADHPLR